MELNYTQKIKELIDNLKARCNSAGLGGDGNEYKVITQSFLYKFLNDKFLHDVVKVKPELADASNITEALESMSENDYNLMLARLGGGSAKLKPEHLITTLFNRQNESEFHKLFNDTLHDIAVMNTGTFSVHTDEGTDVLLFDNELFNSVSDSSKRNSLARAVINLLANEKLDFSMAFDQGFDFFSTIFEYMIKDYNANGGGVYAEYYTPRSVARIMADILVGDEKPENVKILDPSAGSGTLLMSIAHKIGSENCSIYSQDISQKSSNLLRLNLILNNLAHSISHVVEGNTVTHPAHQNIVKNEGFDYIVSNPPFKLDFSEYRNEIANSEANAERFFAGVPTIPNKKKESMAIYLLFIQHIMHSLGEHGKAAVVVPTGFITAQSSIEKAIRERLVERHWLKGVVSMPSNIFATTGTNVSVVFIDKDGGDKITLVDASKLGEKIKEGKNQRTILSPEEERQIVEAFSSDEGIEDFSVHPKIEEVKQKNYSLSAGQYFEIKIQHVDITEDEFKSRITDYQNELDSLFTESDGLGRKIKENLGKLNYEK
ncbi:SAM-dependent DNA methyltransferase [Candidatus Saccharibacteria bacterium]|nr:SAM-dependent DNA methyltransferase [Candidatus Saccharibacteria bacterium]